MRRNFSGDGGRKIDGDKNAYLVARPHATIAAIISHEMGTLLRGKISAGYLLTKGHSVTRCNVFICDLSAFGNIYMRDDDVVVWIQSDDRMMCLRHGLPPILGAPFFEQL